MKYNVDTIVNEILRSKKYSGIDQVVIERICSEHAPRYSRQKDAVKAVKKELHIIHGSFLSKDCHALAWQMLRNYQGADVYTDMEFAAQLMGLHTSTAERAGRLTDIYAMVGGYIDPGDTVIDIGCGFNPFSLPFLRNRPKAYHAYDISDESVKLINAYFKPLGPAYRAELFDAVTQTPRNSAVSSPAPRPAADSPERNSAASSPAPCPTADSPVSRSPEINCILLMFKLFPLLEQQKKGRAFELLLAAPYRTAIVSFPTKSASGRERGMEAFYTDMFTRGLPDGLVIREKKAFDNEIFFIVARL